jgi:hypothetical protein
MNRLSKSSKATEHAAGDKTITIEVDGEMVVEGFTAEFAGDNISGSFEGSMPYTYESYDLDLEYVGHVLRRSRDDRGRVVRLDWQSQGATID